jgi:hypothetical protein
MTLNSSGPISFGGSTTGQSINLELGVSATALASINSTSFRTLAGVASGQISLSNFYGKSNATYWFATLGYNSGNSGDPTCGHAVNSNGIAIPFNYPNLPTAYSIIYRISFSGSVSSIFTGRVGTYYLTPVSSQGLYDSPIVLDSSDNIYTSNPNDYGTIGCKITSSNSFASWGYGYYSSVTNPGAAPGIYTNGTNFYTPAWFVTGSGSCLIYKAGVQVRSCSTGAITSQVFTAAQQNTYYCSAYDGSTYFYAGADTYIIKFNPNSSSIVWNATIGYAPLSLSANGNYLAYTIGIASQGYMALLNASTTPPTSLFVLTITGLTFSNCGPCCIDSSGNTYFLMKCTSSNNYGWGLIKVNSSGTVQWQRQILTASYTGTLGGAQSNYGFISVIGSYLHISFMISGSRPLRALIQYPTDGSKTGTYTAGQGSISIATSSFTITTSSNTPGTTTIIYASPSYSTGQAVTSTTTNPSYTNTFTTL